MKNLNKDSRRNFLQTGIVTAASLMAGADLFGNGPSIDDLEKMPAAELSCLDYGKSFICNTGQYNAVRLWIESRTTIVDTKSGRITEYLQCGSCKSEDTFAEKNLFFKDNYNFLPIFGGGQVLVFRRHVDLRDSYRIIKPMTQMWGGDPVLRRIKAGRVTELKTFEEIRDITAAGIPIVTQTEIHNEETGLKAILECPCKTMNISHVKKVYQADNGPVALPDLSKRYDPEIACLSLAFIAFNTADFTDFVIEDATPVVVDGREAAKVYHYSRLLTLSSKNRILALGKI
ncbi:MAG TPA: hypothetical protein VGM41_13055 [Chitinophagaceae bacterium]|jgi:hypothetical protein